MTTPNILKTAPDSLWDTMINTLADELDPQGNRSSDYEAFKQKYFHDLEGFAKDCIIWASDGLTDYQAEGMRRLVKHKRFSMRGPHGLGKTAFAAIVILWFSLTRDGQDWKIPTLASAWRQLTKFLWPEVHLWSKKLRWDKVGRKPFTQKELLTLNMKLSTGEAFAIASDNSAMIEGAHAKHMLYIFDESKVIPDDTWDAAEGAFSTGECYWLAISTPGEPKGRFYDIHSRKDGYEDWSVLYVSLAMAIKAGRINPAWAEQRKKQWGESSAVYKNRVLGEFASSDEDGVISLSDVERSNERWLERNEAGTWGIMTGLGVDIGRGGDPSVLAREYDNNGIRELIRLQTRNSAKIAGLITGILVKMLSCVAVIDLGYNPGVYDTVREGSGDNETLDANIRSRTRPFVAAGKTDLRDSTGELGFVNQRSAAWWNMRELLQSDLYDLPPDDKLTGDLTAPKWAVKAGGRIQVEGKDETSMGEGIRKRLKRSTDDGDAVVMIAFKRNITADVEELDELGHIDDYQSRWK